MYEKDDTELLFDVCFLHSGIQKLFTREFLSTFACKSCRKLCYISFQNNYNSILYIAR